MAAEALRVLNLLALQMGGGEEDGVFDFAGVSPEGFHVVGVLAERDEREAGLFVHVVEIALAIALALAPDRALALALAIALANAR